MTRARADARRQLDLFVTFVERELWLRGKRSLLSTLWPVISPLFLMALYMFLFGRVFDADIPRYAEFLLCGLLPWSFLTQSLGKTIVSISSEPDLIRKAWFPYELLPIGTVGGHALNFLLTMAMFLVYLGITGQLAYGLIPFLFLPMVSVILLVMALAMVVSLIDVYNKDLRLVIGNLLTVWFFLLPIVYRPEMAPSSLRFLRSIDPMSLIVSQFRGVLYFREIRGPEDHLVMVLLAGGLFLVCRKIFQRMSPSLPKDV